MGVQTIIGLIEREAAEESAGIVADAERTAADLVAGAEADVATRVDEALDRHGAEIRAESQRRINTVRLRVLENRATLDAERLGAVFQAADDRLRAIADGVDGADGADGVRWSAALVRLSKDALESVGPAARLRVRRRDAPALADLVAERRAELEVADDGTPAGAVVTSADGRIEIDASLPVRLERARTLLAESVAAMLALRPGDVGGDAVETTGDAAEPGGGPSSPGGDASSPGWEPGA